MLIHRLAIRNLMRNRRRSILTALIIIATTALMTVFQGLSDGGHRAMIDVGVRMGLGHLVINSPAYLQDPSLKNLIHDPGALTRDLENRLPEVEHAVPRLRINALIQAGGNTVAITASGVVPEQEVVVSGIADKRSIQDGVTLAEDTTRERNGLPGIVFGDRLAKALGVGLGDRVTLTVKPADGDEFSRDAFELVGIYRTGMLELDGFWAEIPLDKAQRLARTPDQVSVVALYVKDDRELKSIRSKLESELSSRSQSLSVQTWNQAAPELNSAVTLDAAGMTLMQVIVYVVVAAGILNTVVLSVMRRTREFGMMLALGSPPSVVVRVVLLEATYLTVISLALGYLAGLSMHTYFATEGLNFREIFGTSFEAGGVMLPDRFYSVVSPLKIAMSALFIFVLTLLVSTFPAIRAGKQSPLESIRHA